MPTIHDIYDGLQSLAVLTVALGWVYTRLHKSDSNQEHQSLLTERLENLDEKMTQAMTRMANEVSSLARSVSKLEGQLEVMRYSREGR